MKNIKYIHRSHLVRNRYGTKNLGEKKQLTEEQWVSTIFLSFFIFFLCRSGCWWWRWYMVLAQKTLNERHSPSYTKTPKWIKWKEWIAQKKKEKNARAIVNYGKWQIVQRETYGSHIYIHNICVKLTCNLLFLCVRFFCFDHLFEFRFYFIFLFRY